MKPPPFKPKLWACDIFITRKTKEGILQAKTKFCRETLYLNSQKEAEEMAEQKSQNFETCEYKAEARPCNPADLAHQRAEQLGNWLAKQIEELLVSEEKILAYDTYLYGKKKLQDVITQPIQEAIELTFEEPATPEQMGWLSSKGTP